MISIWVLLRGQMTTIDEVRKRYGIPKDIAVEAFDYTSIPTPDLLRRIDGLRAKIKEFSDTTFEESLDINELPALESELERRIKESASSHLPQ